MPPLTIEKLKIPEGLAARYEGVDVQPVSQIRWVLRDELHANDYNPNHVHPPELLLLALSILLDGWTQPIVARPDSTVVDGYHRWLISGHPLLRAMTNGRVPVVFLSSDHSEAELQMSTIRHNRARGAHGVLPMSVIVRRLVDEQGIEPKEVARLLQMEDEEVDRLYDTGGMVKRGSGAEMGKGWVPRRKKL